MSKFREGERVESRTVCGKIWLPATVQKVLPNPYTPNWMDGWLFGVNYLIWFDGSTEPFVVSQRKMRKYDIS